MRYFDRVLVTVAATEQRIHAFQGRYGDARLQGGREYPARHTQRNSLAAATGGFGRLSCSFEIDQGKNPGTREYLFKLEIWLLGFQ